jgi:hypothetical protein
MVFAVELRERQFDRHRTGGEDHIGRRQRLLRTIMRGDFDLTPRQQLAPTGKGRDLVALEQHRDAAGELLHDLVLATDHGADVDLGVVGRDAVRREAVRQVVELLGRIQHRLGRNAADVQAGAAERRLAVLADEGIDAGRLQTQLRRADRRDIPAGTAANDDDIEILY